MSWRTVHGDPSTVLAIVELDEGPWLYTFLTESLARMRLDRYECSFRGVKKVSATRCSACAATTVVNCYRTSTPAC
ncbi:hypothetical protein ACETU7_15115 [Rhodococcus sp. 3Y1]